MAGSGCARPPQRRPGTRRHSGPRSKTARSISSRRTTRRSATNETGKLAAGPDPAFPADRQRSAGSRNPPAASLRRHGDEGPDGPRKPFAQLTAGIPAALYGLDAKGAIAPGKDADLVIWNAEKVGHLRRGRSPRQTWATTPFEGVTVTGWPEDGAPARQGHRRGGHMPRRAGAGALDRPSAPARSPRAVTLVVINPNSSEAVTKGHRHRPRAPARLRHADPVHDARRRTAGHREQPRRT